MSEMLVFLLFLLCFSNSEQAIKEWTPDLSFNNSLNWTPSRVPCSLDRIVYPLDMRYELQLGGAGGRVWVAALQLPRDGGLLLPKDGELRLGDMRPGDKCPGEEMHFTNNIIRFWEDPYNWRTWDGTGNTQLPGEGGPAVPHLERLPCHGDGVRFPALHGLVVQLPSDLHLVKGIFIKNKLLSRMDWINLVESRPLTFIKSLDGMPPPLIFPFRLGFAECQIFPLARMCSLVKCDQPRCLQPVQPVNHCCKICGAVILLHNVTESSAKERIRQLVSERVAQAGRGVRWWAGSWKEPILWGMQVVLVDKEDYEGASSDIASAVKEELDIHSGELQFSKSSLAVSGLPWRGLDAAQGGWEALVMLAAVLAALLAVLLYYYPPAGATRTFTQFSIPSPFGRSFARFDNRSREGSLVLGISQLSLDKAFDNPMYAAAARHQPEVVQKSESEEEEYEVKESNPEAPDTEEEDLLEETTFQE